MSKKSENPEQLQLPFTEETQPASAKIVSLSAFRRVSDLVGDHSGNLERATDKEILDRILRRAERLSWYK